MCPSFVRINYNRVSHDPVSNYIFMLSNATQLLFCRWTNHAARSNLQACEVPSMSALYANSFSKSTWLAGKIWASISLPSVRFSNHLIASTFDSTDAANSLAIQFTNVVIWCETCWKVTLASFSRGAKPCSEASLTSHWRSSEHLTHRITKVFYACSCFYSQTPSVFSQFSLNPWTCTQCALACSWTFQLDLPNVICTKR